MPPDNPDDIFGEHVPDSATAAIPHRTEPSPPDEVEVSKYGIGKPRRIIVRGKVAADTDTENQRD